MLCIAQNALDNMVKILIVQCSKRRRQIMASKATTANSNQNTAWYGELGGQAEQMFEKGTRINGELTTLAKDNAEAMLASAKIAATGLQGLAQQMAETSKLGLEQMTSAARQIAAVKSPTEFFQLQSELSKSAFDQFLNQSAKMSEATIKLASEAAQPLSTRYSVTQDKMKAMFTF
jgi:phasin family protein